MWTHTVHVSINHVVIKKNVKTVITKQILKIIVHALIPHYDFHIQVNTKDSCLATGTPTHQVLHVPPDFYFLFLIIMEIKRRSIVLVDSLFLFCFPFPES